MSMPERVLWRELKGLKGTGFHFRRQAPIGRCFADFICHGARLAIEVDGHLHGSDHALEHDDARTRFFESEGYAVLRFTNIDVATNLEGVMMVIVQALATAGKPKGSPHPQPLPTRGRGAKPTTEAGKQGETHGRS